jgi:energy-coupling factor transporter ATP-binding protein EcfA2
VLDTNTSPRHETVEKLATLLDEKAVVHVRGTPATGKSTLAKLLTTYLKNQGKRAIFLEWHPLDKEKEEKL